MSFTGNFGANLPTEVIEYIMDVFSYPEGFTADHNKVMPGIARFISVPIGQGITATYDIPVDDTVPIAEVLSVLADSMKSVNCFGPCIATVCRINLIANSMPKDDSLLEAYFQKVYDDVMRALREVDDLNELDYILHAYWGHVPGVGMDAHMTFIGCQHL